LCLGSERTFSDATRAVRQPLAMPGFNKMSLINYNATRAVGLPVAMPGKLKTFLKTTDATPSAFDMRFTVTSRLFTLMKQKNYLRLSFSSKSQTFL
jgi:hypothetical protein